jgi:Na+/proline symporter
MVNWDWTLLSFTTTAFWVVILGGISQGLVPYSSDQAIVQRYMITPDEKRAARAIWTNAIICIPASLLFFGLGTALFVYYKGHPQQLDPTYKTDAIFPLFIARQLPVGIAGLVVAGIFAAAQSTVSTSLNSMSATIVTDFIRRFNLLRSEQAYLRVARLITFIAGCFGTVLAILFVLSDIRSAWEAFMKILGLFGGSMCGLFLLGIFTKRANSTGALVGAFIGAIGLFCVQRFTALHGLLYAAVGIVFCCVSGYTASFILPTDKKSISGLTIFTIRESYNTKKSFDK